MIFVNAFVTGLGLASGAVVAVEVFARVFHLGLCGHCL